MSRLGSTMGGEPEYIFKHALVRDVAYESIPRRDRAMARLEVDAGSRRRLESAASRSSSSSLTTTPPRSGLRLGRVEPDRREEIRSRAVDLLFEAAEEAGPLSR